MSTFWNDPFFSLEEIDAERASDARLQRERGRRRAEDRETRRCFCPDDCNCHYSWRFNYCGCKAHRGEEG